jgi:ribosomal protein S18 acetylase RimI-like enzyme
MNVRMRPYRASDLERALGICIAAFSRIHEGFAEALGQKVFAQQYGDWREQYAATFAQVDDKDAVPTVYVAELDDAVVGFVFVRLDAKRKTGEIGLNAVMPAFQGRGIGKTMHAFALAELKRRGAEIAYVGTGGDAAHAPARKAYAAAGFDKSIPGVHLFKVL